MLPAVRAGVQASAHLPGTALLRTIGSAWKGVESPGQVCGLPSAALLHAAVSAGRASATMAITHLAACTSVDAAASLGRCSAPCSRERPVGWIDALLDAVRGDVRREGDGQPPPAPVRSVPSPQ